MVVAVLKEKEESPNRELIPNAPEATSRCVQSFSPKENLSFCFEVGPVGNGNLFLYKKSIFINIFGVTIRSKKWSIIKKKPIINTHHQVEPIKKGGV